MKALSIQVLLFGFSAVLQAAEPEPKLHSDLFAGTEFTPTVLDENVTTLEDGRLYYLTESVTFDRSGETSDNPSCGLAVGSGAKVYVYIPKDMTLTCKGGNGSNAKSGEDAQRAGYTVKSRQDDSSEIYYPYAEFTAPSAGSAGTAAVGGAPGIYLPADSSLVVFGEGKLVAAGGAGGAGGNGGNGVESSYFFSSWYSQGKDLTYGGNAGSTGWLGNVDNNVGHDPKSGWSGTSVNWPSVVVSSAWNGQPASGAGGGGGGGGGGAAIGTYGTAGRVGRPGSKHDTVWDTDGVYQKGLSVVSGQEGGTDCGSAAAEAGALCLADAIDRSLTAGKGGVAGVVGSGSHNKTSFRPKKPTSTGLVDSDYTLYLVHGQPGGGGGKGGDGAAFGFGGQGGGGGGGGSTGSFTDSYNAKATDFCGTPVVGENADKGGDGNSRTAGTLENAQYPYSTVAFGNASESRYYFTRSTSVTVPSGSAPVFVGWQVTNSATRIEALASGDGNKTFLSGDATLYRAQTTAVPGKYTYGDVALGEQILKVKTADGDKPITVADSTFFDAYLRGRSVSEMSTFMNGNGANGLKVWQDYVLGLDHKDKNATIRIAAEPRPDGQSGVRIRPIKQLTPRTDAGFSVSYLLKSPDDETGTKSQNQEFDVGLPTIGGRYRLELQINAN